MKIGFIGLPNPGHLNPMSALARQLQSRNHDVVMFSPPVGELLARAAGLPFVPFSEREFSPDKLVEIVGACTTLKPQQRRVNRTSGESGNQGQLGGPILFVLGSPLDHTVSSGI